MIVVDVGCKSYDGEDSLETLRERYEPHVIFGFDPHPMLAEGVEQFTGVPACTVITRRLAAWTHYGIVGWHAEGSRSKVNPVSAKTVPCFRLATFLGLFAHVDVLKIDAEGAEYTLIPDLIEAGADERVGTLLVEWHGPPLKGGRWEVLPWH